MMSHFILGEEAVTVHFVLTITVLGCYLNNLTSVGRRVCATVKYELERELYFDNLIIFFLMFCLHLYLLNISVFIVASVVCDNHV